MSKNSQDDEFLIKYIDWFSSATSEATASDPTHFVLTDYFRVTKRYNKCHKEIRVNKFDFLFLHI